MSLALILLLAALTSHQVSAYDNTNCSSNAVESVAMSKNETLYVQLQWYFQASASSVWLPIGIGLYNDENLTVVVNQGGPNINVEFYVLKQVASIGFAWLSPVMESYLTGNDNDEMVVVAQVDQVSSQRLVTLKSSGINSLLDLEGKTVCTWSQTSLSPVAALTKLGVTFKSANLGNTPYPLLAGTCDAVQVLTYNELGLLFQMTDPSTGNLVKESDLNVFELGDDSFAMEDVIFVKKSWIAIPDNQIVLHSFLRAVVKTAIFIRDNPKLTLNYYNPSSNIDQWQLYICNQMAWNNAEVINTYGMVNGSQVQKTIENMIAYRGFTNLNVNVSQVFDNSYISAVVEELKGEGYKFDVKVPTDSLTWCLDIGASLLHICRGDERTQQVISYKELFRIINIVLSLLLLAGTLCVFYATFANRNKNVVRIASPNYLYIMLSGACLMYIGNVVYNFGVNVASCHIYIWGISLGFTLLFAPYISKTWRIYRVFDLKRRIDSYKISWLPFALLMWTAIIVNIIILVLFSSLNSVKDTPVVSPFDVYILYKTCHWNHTIGYILIGYTSVMFLSSIWLAYLVRNVKFTDANESRPIVFAIGLTIGIVIFVLIMVFYQSNPNTSILFQSLGICVVACVNTCIMFGKRLYLCTLLSNAEMDKFGKSSQNGVSNNKGSTGGDSSSHNTTSLRDRSGTTGNTSGDGTKRKKSKSSQV